MNNIIVPAWRESFSKYFSFSKQKNKWQAFRAHARGYKNRYTEQTTDKQRVIQADRESEYRCHSNCHSDGTPRSHGPTAKQMFRPYIICALIIMKG